MAARWMTGALAVLLVCFLGGVGGAQQFSELPAGIPNARGVAWGDYDDDGYPDLFLGGEKDGYPGYIQHGPMLFRNNGNLTFTDVSATLGFDSVTVVEQDGPAWADYDNDGLLDLIAASGSRYPFLYHRINGEFTDVAAEAGIIPSGVSRHAAWCDYDGDNWLDVFVPINGYDSLLYRNNGDGTFADAHVETGILTGGTGGVGGMSASWGDYDNDGRSDLLISRVIGTAMLYHNNGNGTFTDVSSAAGIAVAYDTYSAIWGDYDNDGWLDCYLTSSQYTEPQTRRDYLFHNNRNGTFTEGAATAGMGADTSVGIGAGWGDYDNDGWLDLYVGNYEGENHPFLYHNNGNGSFTNVIGASGLDGSFQNDGAAWADIDLDGRLDLAQGTSNDRTRLFHNVGPAGNWLRLRALTTATGAATVSDLPARDAIGARVDLNLDNDDSFPSGRTLARIVGGGSGHAAQNEQVAHFGVGSSSAVCVRVLFPDGSVVTHRSVPVNRQLTIRDVPADRTEEVFDDVPLDFWAYEESKACVSSGIVAGYPDGLYHGANPVTRDQMAVYIARALASGDENVPEFTDTPTFPDVGSEHWALKYVEHAVDQSVVGGYEDGSYHPEYEVDRGQMAVYVARALVAPEGEAGLADYVPADPRDFPDVASDFWAYTHVEYCVENGVVAGYLDGYYHPEIVVTRDQMAVYVARAFEL